MDSKTYKDYRQMKTIDDLVNRINEYYTINKYDNITNEAYENIVANDLDLVLAILKSENNKPSVYDLFIINEINRVLSKILYIFQPGHVEMLNDVLEIYKNRKE